MRSISIYLPKIAGVLFLLAAAAAINFLTLSHVLARDFAACPPTFFMM